MTMAQKTTGAPRCPQCRGEAAAYDRDFRPMPSPALWCAHCGHRWDGTPEERERAEAADAAWLATQPRAWL